MIDYAARREASLRDITQLPADFLGIDQALLAASASRVRGMNELQTGRDQLNRNIL